MTKVNIIKKQPCKRCFWLDIEEQGSCYCNYIPETEEPDPDLETIFKKPYEDMTSSDLWMVRAEVLRLQRENELLKEFLNWREKMDSLMKQAVNQADGGGDFYYPCAGCSEWERFIRRVKENQLASR